MDSGQKVVSCSPLLFMSLTEQACCRVLHGPSATGGDFSEIVPPWWGGDTQGGDGPYRGGTQGGDKVRQGGDAKFREIWTIFSARAKRAEIFFTIFSKTWNFSSNFGTFSGKFSNFLKKFGLTGGGSPP